jgi:hypothetical protein
MKHIRTISATPAPAQNFLGGGLELAESLVILFLTAGFQGWDNFQPVIQNLQKFYSKT